MARKCAHVDDQCSCIMRYPNGDYVQGDGTPDSPFIFDNCDPIVYTQDCEQRTSSIPCNGLIQIIQSRTGRIAAEVSPTFEGIFTRYIDYESGAIEGISANDISVIKDLNLPRTTTVDNINPFFDEINYESIIKPFDLNIKSDRDLCIYVSLIVCQRIPAPSRLVGECREMGLNISNLNSSASSTGLLEYFNPSSNFWYPPDSINDQGCTNLVFSKCLNIGAGFYNDISMYLTHSEGGVNSCPYNISRQLYVKEGQIVLAW